MKPVGSAGGDLQKNNDSFLKAPPAVALFFPKSVNVCRGKNRSTGWSRNPIGVC